MHVVLALNLLCNIDASQKHWRPAYIQALIASMLYMHKSTSSYRYMHI